MSVTQIATPDHIDGMTAATAVETWEHSSGRLRAIICVDPYADEYCIELYRLHTGGRHGIWRGVGYHEIPTRTGGFADLDTARIGARDALNNTPQR